MNLGTIFYHGRERSFNIESPKSVKMPQKICALYVNSNWQRKQLNGLTCGVADTSQGFVYSIRAMFWSYKNDKESRAEHFSGFKVSQFWEHVRQRSKEGGTIWIFCWDAWPYWCLLRGKEEIDSGRILLDLLPSEHAGETQAQRAKKGSGLFVVSNPPTIISLAIPCGGRLKIVDLKNYGIEPEMMPSFQKEVSLEVVREAVVSYRCLLRSYDLGTWQTTSASQAWYAFRRSHLVHKIQVNPIRRVLELEQAAYYGGRCEAKFIGKYPGRLFHIDVNSMYTYLASVMKFPTRLACTVMNPTQQEALNHLTRYLGAADVTVTTERAIFPAGEHVKHSEGKPPTRSPREHIIYPIGTFRTALAGTELLCCLSNNTCVVHRLQLYESDLVLQKWGQFALSARHSIKRSKIAFMEPCFKKIINCLPGKFGQRQKNWIHDREVKSKKQLREEEKLWIQEWGEHPVNGRITQFRTINNITEYMDDEFLSPLSCPIISAIWTSYGRSFLWSAMELVGHGNVVYYDTDSLIVNEEGYDRAKAAGILDQEKAGSWKTKEVSDDVEICGIRRYRFGKRLCVSGPFGKELNGLSDVSTWTEHESFDSQMNHGNVGDAVTIKRHATLRNIYRHGIVYPDGHVEPFLAGSEPVPYDEPPLRKKDENPESKLKDLI